MREIKFRGYGIKEKKWHYGFVCNYVTFKEWQWFEHYAIQLKESKEKLTIGVYMFEVEENSIGQYTGFKDKNGTEIYEGDIIKVNGNYEIYVEWFNGSWIAKNDFEIMEDERRDWLIDYKNYELEVVGNIYERNKESCEDRKENNG